MDLLMVLVLLAFGLPGAIWPYEVARFQERLDAIGSTRSWSEVEPAGWRVSFVRLVGVCMLVVALLGLILG